MDQISPPFRIALVALLAVCALWFTVLKPKDPPVSEPATTPAAPGATGLGNGVDAAKGAAATSGAANAKVQAATGGTTATTATTTPATGAPATTAGGNGAATPATAKAGTDAAAPLLRALDRKRAVVLLVYNPRGADDRAVRRAVTATDRDEGRVVVKAVPVAKVGSYESITRGAQILQAPTVLVIGPDHEARAVVGFTTTGELDQLVGDALAAAKK